MRCESPSAFLGTCLSHHSFIILLITSTSALLTGLYLISTDHRSSSPKGRMYLCQCPLGLMHHFYMEVVNGYITSQLVLPKHHDQYGVNALSGLCIISTSRMVSRFSMLERCVNALSGLCIISTLRSSSPARLRNVSMPSRAYASFLQNIISLTFRHIIVSMPSRAYASFLL